MTSDSWEEKRNSRRPPASARVEFYITADLINARSVDISETGIRLTTNQPISIRFRGYFGEQGSMERVARLVWAHRNQDGGMDYGLEFVGDEED